MTKNSCPKWKKSKNVLEILVSKPFFVTFLNRRCIPSKFIAWMSEVILSMPYKSICNSCPFLSISVSLYLRDINFSLTPPTLTTDSSAFIPLSFSSLAFLFVMKQREAPLSHNTLANPLFVWILWTCRRHVSIFLLLHVFAGTLISCFSSCKVA